MIGCERSTVIPDALLEPEAAPDVPSPGATDNAIARFILEQDAALDRANAKIAGIAKIVGTGGK